MIESFRQTLDSGWIFFGVLFIGALVFLAVMRRVETKRIFTKFKEDDILMTAFGVNYFGLESEKGGPARSAGAIVLTKTGLWYRARFKNLEIFIPGNTITRVGVTDTHKGKPLHQNALSIVFINEKKVLDKAAFRIPYPDRWYGGLNNLFLKPNAQQAAGLDENVSSPGENRLN